MEVKYLTLHAHNPGHFPQIKTKCLGLLNRLIDLFLLHQRTLDMKTDEHGSVKMPQSLQEHLKPLTTYNKPTHIPLEGPRAENDPLNCTTRDVEAICSATNTRLFLLCDRLPEPL